MEPGNAELLAYQDKVQALRAAEKPSLPSSIALERQINPFMRTREATVIAAAKGFDASAHDETSVLAALRQWKNQF